MKGEELGIPTYQTNNHYQVLVGIRITDSRDTVSLYRLRSAYDE